MEHKRISFGENEEVVNQEVITNCDKKSGMKVINKVPKSSSIQPKLVSPEITKKMNWQALCSSLMERNSAMFNNELMADVYFKINNDRIPCHKYVLATGSSVFAAMFYGVLAKDQNNDLDIEIPDIELGAFLNLLRFLYIDDVQLDADNVLPTLYAAKKYMVPGLVSRCVAFLERNLTASNACLLLSQSRLYEEHNLMQHCWEIIDPQAEEALLSEGFSDIDHDTLDKILEHETMQVKETTVFTAIENWASAQCSRQELPLTPVNKRLVLGNSLYKVRLGALSLVDFANGPAQSDLLTLEESHGLFLHFTATTLRPQRGLSTHPGFSMKFPTRPRQGLAVSKCKRFLTCANRNNQWRYKGRCDSIQFSVDRRIFIAGVGFYGATKPNTVYHVVIHLKTEHATVRQKSDTFTSDGLDSVFYIFFDVPYKAEPETCYTISAILEGSEMSYFGQEGQVEVTVGEVNFQFQCSVDSTNGTGVQGGQIPEILFYT